MTTSSEPAVEIRNLLRFGTSTVGCRTAHVVPPAR